MHTDVDVDALTKQIVDAGVEEQTARRLAIIALEHAGKVYKPEPELVRQEIERAFAKLNAIDTRMTSLERSRLVDCVEAFVLSFLASGAFFLVQDYLTVVLKFFASEESEAINRDKASTAARYEAHRQHIDQNDAQFLSEHLAELDKIRDTFRRQVAIAMDGSLYAPMISLWLEGNVLVPPASAPR